MKDFSKYLARKRRIDQALEGVLHYGWLLGALAVLAVLGVLRFKLNLDILKALGLD